MRDDPPQPHSPCTSPPSVSGRSAIQRAGRGDSLRLLGESLNGSQELHKAHWGCLQWDLRRPGGALSRPARAGRGEGGPPHCVHVPRTGGGPAPTAGQAHPAPSCGTTLAWKGWVVGRNRKQCWGKEAQGQLPRSEQTLHWMGMLSSQ